MPSPKTITNSVPFVDLRNNALANGILVFTLNVAGNGVVSLIPSGEAVPSRFSVTLDSSGNIPSSTTMFSNDQINPSTTYSISFLDANTNVVGALTNVAIVGASPIDLSQLVTTTTGISFPGVVLLSPTLRQRILGFPLELATTLILDGATSGTTTLQATGIAGNTTATLPANTGTIAELNLAQNWIAPQSFTNSPVPNAAGSPDLGTITLPWGNLFIGAAATNNIKIAGTASAARTQTLQDVADTFIYRSSTDTLTNKTIGAGGLAGLTPSKQMFTSSGSFTIPAVNVKVTVVGAGGAGGGATTTVNASGTGGFGGGTAVKWLTGLTVGHTLTVTVGTGGTGVTNGAGNNGGSSSVSSGTQTIGTITGGGGGGGAATGNVVGFNGGSASGGDLNLTGGPPGSQLATNTNAGSPGGTSSLFGGGGSAGFTGAGGAGNNPGAAGGGAGGNAVGAVAGGAGANGIVIFEWVI